MLGSTRNDEGPWELLRFSFDQVRDDPERCQDKLRRLLISEVDLHPNFAQTINPSRLQQEALQALAQTRAKGYKKGLVCLPTGTGKTILSALDAKRVGGRVLFVVHNNHILKQAEAAYIRVFGNASTGFINSEVEVKGSTERLLFGNISSLRSDAALSKFSKTDFNYIVFDEFHHAASPSYQRILNYFTPSFVLGITATPERTDGKSILKLLDSNVVYSVGLGEAVDRGFLVPFTYYGLKDNVDYSNIRHNGFRYDINDHEKALIIPRRNKAIFDTFTEIVQDKPTIGFCVSIQHADMMAEYFKANGRSSVAIHSELTTHERNKRILQFESGEVQIVFVRDIFNEGVDFPRTAAVLFLRPTESKIIFMQQLGRGLRLSPMKTNILVLDFIGNYYGSGQVPSFVRQAAGDPLFFERLGKPKFIYDNGCEIIFSKDVVEHLQYADFKLVDESYAISRLIAMNERIRRPLNPLDLYVDLKDEFGRFMRTFGGFERMAARLNSLGGDGDVIDRNFLNFNPNTDLSSEYNEIYVSQKAHAATDSFTAIISIIDKESKNIHSISNRLRTTLLDLQQHLSVLCLLEVAIKAYSESETDHVISTKAAYETNSNAPKLFKSIAKLSSSRVSYSIANGLSAQYPGIRHLVLKSNDDRSQRSTLRFAARMIDYSVLSWVKDLYALCDPEKLD
jgi:superfamily II DNA or RNA helicase